MIVADFSDSSFSIAVPSVSVVSPDGGESWPIGSSREITWNAADFSNSDFTLIPR